MHAAFTSRAGLDVVVPLFNRQQSSSAYLPYTRPLCTECPQDYRVVLTSALSQLRTRVYSIMNYEQRLLYVKLYSKLQSDKIHKTC